MSARESHDATTVVELEALAAARQEEAAAAAQDRALLEEVDRRVAAQATWMGVVDVVGVIPGGAVDGSALLTVSWRGTDLETGYSDRYSPVIGDRVVLSLTNGFPFVVAGYRGEPSSE